MPSVHHPVSVISGPLKSPPRRISANGEEGRILLVLSIRFAAELDEQTGPVGFVGVFLSIT